jgi:hypothetical protein
MTLVRTAIERIRRIEQLPARWLITAFFHRDRQPLSRIIINILKVFLPKV